MDITLDQSTQIKVSNKKEQLKKHCLLPSKTKIKKALHRGKITMASSIQALTISSIQVLGLLGI